MPPVSLFSVDNFLNQRHQRCLVAEESFCRWGGKPITTFDPEIQSFLHLKTGNVQCALNLYQIFFNCSVTEYNSTLKTLQQRTRPDQDERRESRLIARLRGRPGPRARPTTIKYQGKNPD